MMDMRKRQAERRVDAMHAAVEIGQNWSIWDPSRRQWLLGTVTRRADGQATLKYDSRYRIGVGHDERSADESTMLSARNLFRLVEGG
jgi:hypothetical protein